MAAIYTNLDVLFAYPENWTVTHEDSDSRPQSVVLQSPGSAMWSLFIYENESAAAQAGPSGIDYVREYVEGIRGEFEDVEANVYADDFDDAPASGYDLYFYYLDLLVHARAFFVKHGGRTFVLAWQAEDREFEELEAVFRAITITLLDPDRIEMAPTLRRRLPR